MTQGVVEYGRAHGRGAKSIEGASSDMELTPLTTLTAVTASPARGAGGGNTSLTTSIAACS